VDRCRCLQVPSLADLLAPVCLIKCDGEEKRGERDRRVTGRGRKKTGEGTGDGNDEKEGRRLDLAVAVVVEIEVDYHLNRMNAFFNPDKYGLLKEKFAR